MKTLRQICAATILSLALSVCALAGQIEVNGVVAQPPPATQSTGTATTILLTMLSLIYR